LSLDFFWERSADNNSDEDLVLVVKGFWVLNLQAHNKKAFISTKLVQQQ